MNIHSRITAVLRTVALASAAVIVMAMSASPAHADPSGCLVAISHASTNTSGGESAFRNDDISAGQELAEEAAAQITVAVVQCVGLGPAILLDLGSAELANDDALLISGLPLFDPNDAADAEAEATAFLEDALERLP